MCDRRPWGPRTGGPVFLPPSPDLSEGFGESLPKVEVHHHHPSQRWADHRRNRQGRDACDRGLALV